MQISSPGPHSADPGLADKVEFLSRPATYSDAPDRVQIIETHMSWLFLTPQRVYKLKKPVSLPLQDYTTPAARRHCCYEELRLNRRLAKDVYLSVETLTIDVHGSLQLGGTGRPVDWLVQMRRLPPERMLDDMIRHRRIDRPALGKAADLLARFYRSAQAAPCTGSDYRLQLMRRVMENHRVLADHQYRLPRAQVERVTGAQRDLIDYHPALFNSRTLQNRIVEGHGDLRPEHIVLIDPPVIIDCLEFNRELRLLDPLEELAYLQVECDVAGAPQAAACFYQRYREDNDDHPSARLFAFYCCYRACLRAKLSLWHLRDDPRQCRHNWSALALRYLDRADQYCRVLTN